MNTITGYDIIRRILVDDQLVEALRTDPQGTLGRLGISDPIEVTDLMKIFNLMLSGASQQSTLNQKLQEQFFGTLEVAKEMKKV
jgi:hypothetical protein